MRVFRDIDHLPKLSNAVVTIGTFDGVHLGHQKIIAQLKAQAVVIDGETVIVTFYPHPRKVVHKEQKPLYLLNTLSEKLHLLEHYGVDNVIVVPFNDRFASQTAEQYVEDFLIGKLHPKVIIIGYDHKFGKDRLGDYKTLERYGEKEGFSVVEIPERLLNEVTISSTRIRAAIREGDIAQTNAYLGHPYRFSGAVVRGNQLGRTIGFPTANISITDHEKLLPANGVYAVRVLEREGTVHKGMLNIGFRPTIDGKVLTTEVHIFDFDKDIYGEHLEIQLISRLRDEQKFDGLDALTAQLKKDESDAIRALEA